ncbi:hypothetical protein D9M69_504880 [compost metagenome]
MPHGGDTPDQQTECIANPAAEPVDQAAEDQQPQGVAGLKNDHQIAVVAFTPVEFLLQQRLEQA